MRTKGIYSPPGKKNHPYLSLGNSKMKESAERLIRYFAENA